MEPGFLIDAGDGTRTVPEWVEGEPVKSFWTGVKTSGKARLRVSTYRCRRCGYLESYA